MCYIMIFVCTNWLNITDCQKVSKFYKKSTKSLQLMLILQVFEHPFILNIFFLTFVKFISLYLLLFGLLIIFKNIFINKFNILSFSEFLCNLSHNKKKKINIYFNIKKTNQHTQYRLMIVMFVQNPYCVIYVMCLISNMFITEL